MIPTEMTTRENFHVVNKTVFFSFQRESPRWLIAKVRLLEAKIVLQDMARENQMDMDIEQELKSITPKGTNNSVLFCSSFKQLIKSNILVVRMAILSFNW